jgi:hypothetical protein
MNGDTSDGQVSFFYESAFFCVEIGSMIKGLPHKTGIMWSQYY